ncbi:MAG TPA: carboxymuconolactone decarboxylase family protein [Solirubrobacteraceae bacterium]|nr:carboxymuconolactone decarboxylase family protein [Solirubrobacteraceae bacterium]
MRADYRSVLPEVVEAMLGLERVAGSNIEDERLAHLIRLRASQINHCAFCVRLHAAEARGAGESEERLQMVAVWREAECFTAAERAALAWCEALTLLTEREVSDELYAELARHFSEREIVALTLAVVAINGWNRLNVGFRTPAKEAARVASGELRS